MKTISALIIAIFIVLSMPADIHAVENEAASAATMVVHLPVNDPRVDRLERFLTRYNPEISGSSAHFIKEADRFGLDWKLVASIAGLESTFCRFIPQNSYNCWGWGIPTGAKSGTVFKSYNDGITEVSKGLREKYLDEGLLTVEEIGRKYAASPTWAYRVRFFMEKIENDEQSVVKLPDFLL